MVICFFIIVLNPIIIIIITAGAVIVDIIVSILSVSAINIVFPVNDSGIFSVSDMVVIVFVSTIEGIFAAKISDVLQKCVWSKTD